MVILREMKTTKTAISIPREVFDAADRLARRLGLSRSELYSRAVSTFIRDHRDEGVTAALNTIYVDDSSELDPVLARMQWASLEADPWK